MIRSLAIFLIALFLVAPLISCSTSQETTDEEVLAALDEGDLGEDEDLEDADEGIEDELAEGEPSELEEEVADVAEEPADDMAEEEEPMEELVVEAEEEEPVDDMAASEPPVQDFADGPTVDVSNIQFRANKRGGTIVIETTGAADFQTRVNEQTNQFVVEISNANLPGKLKRPYIMKEFEAAFAAINAYQSPGSTTARVVIQLKQGGVPAVQQEGNTLMIIPPSMDMAEQQPESAPMPVAAQKAKDAWMESYDTDAAAKSEAILGARTLDEFLTGSNTFFGRKISIEVSDTDIRDVISFIAQESGVNLVLTEEVKGKISLKLRRVPWDQALVIVMKANKLGYVRQGNVIRISSLASLKSETDAAKAIIDSQKSFAPLRVKVVPVSFAKVEDLVKQLKPFLTNQRGKVVEDKRTSSLIITDTDETIQKVMRLIKHLDIPPAQVMIEGKVVEASQEFQQTVGINWGFSGSDVTVSDSGGVGGGPIDLNASLNVNAVDATTSSLGNLGLSVGTLDFLGDLEATLQLAETDSKINIISSPRVVTINKEPAEIAQSGQVVNITSIVDDGKITKKVERTPVEMKLSVTPQITSDGSVILNVEVKRQFAGPILDNETLARAVSSREAKTKVLVKNGQTAVVGGIYQNDENESIRGLPGLKNIPVLGWLFKSKSQERVKNELLIFLTPRILNIQEQGVDSVEETQTES